MEILIERVLILLTTPPGNIAYFLVLLISVIGALQGVWEQRGKPVEPAVKSAIFGFLILLATVLTPFVFQLLSWMGSTIGHNAFHLVEDACISIGIVWIVRLCIPFEHQKIGDIPAIILTVIFFILFVVVGLLNQTGITIQEIQHSIYDKTWHILTLSIIPPALFILWVKHKKKSTCGTAILLMALAGQILYLVTYYKNADPTGTIHFFQFFSYPLLLYLPQLRTESKQSNELPSNGDTVNLKEPHNLEELKEEVFVEILQPLLMQLDSEEHVFNGELVKAFSMKMEADVAYLILSTTDKSIRLESGCDLLNEHESLPSINLEEPLAGKIIPYLSNQATILEGDDHGDIKDEIGKLLLLPEQGSIMFAPIPRTNLEDRGSGFLLHNTGSERKWSVSDKNRAELICKAIGPILNFYQKQEVLTQDLITTNEQLTKSVQNIEEFQIKNKWFGDVDLLMMPLSGMINVILKELEDFKESLNQLSKKDHDNLSHKDSTELEVYEERFRLLLEEVARLKLELKEAEKKYESQEEFKASRNDSLPGEFKLIDCSFEIRQSMTAIIGYVEILLAEKFGILGERQRSCLQKILESSMLIHELLQGMNEPDLNLPIGDEKADTDIESVVDLAIKQTGDILHKKQISLQLDFPHTLPTIKLAQNTFLNIVKNLFQLVCLSSNKNGFIRFHIDFVMVDQEDFILLEMDKVRGDSFPWVQNPGTGNKEPISVEVLPHLDDFHNIYSTIKSLVENISGRIWVDNPESGGFSISILLPCEIEK